MAILRCIPSAWALALRGATPSTAAVLAISLPQGCDVASVIVLLMGAEQERSGDIEGLRAGGHAVMVLEPRYPECKATLEKQRPDLIVVDGVRTPSHGRTTASWLSTTRNCRTTPFLFLDVADRDVARVKKELPRAQFATWASLAGAAQRLLQR